MAVHKDLKCHRCGRPLRPGQGFKRQEGRFLNRYCDEHVVINILTHTWRLLEPGEDPPPAMAAGKMEPDPPAAEEIEAEVKREPAVMFAAEDGHGNAVPATESVHVTIAPADDFDPLNDVGF